jgi:hypothetical protein
MKPTKSNEISARKNPRPKRQKHVLMFLEVPEWGI